MTPTGKKGSLSLVLYTREGCHLCEEMLAEIRHARLGRDCELRLVDVVSDPALAERYGRSIPVLEIEGRAAFKGRMTAEELRRKVDRARRESDAG